MEKMTRKVIAILTVGALLFALPFAAAADIVDYPEQGGQEAVVPLPAELPPEPEPEAAPAELPPEEPVAEEPAEDVPGEEASEEALDEEALEEEEQEEELPADEVLEVIVATGFDSDAFAPFSGELTSVIDELQDIRDQINNTLDAILALGPYPGSHITQPQWDFVQDYLAFWTWLWYEEEWTIGGTVVQGLEELFAYLLANWGSISPEGQQWVLNELQMELDEALAASVILDFILCAWAPTCPNPGGPGCPDYDFFPGACPVCSPHQPQPGDCEWPWNPNCDCEKCDVDDGIGICVECGLPVDQCVFCNECLSHDCTCPTETPPVLCPGGCGQPVASCTCPVETPPTLCPGGCGQPVANCTCPTETPPPPTPPTPPTPSAVTTLVAVIAPQTGDTTSAQLPFVTLLVSLFTISGLSLAKFRMRAR